MERPSWQGEIGSIRKDEILPFLNFYKWEAGQIFTVFLPHMKWSHKEMERKQRSQLFFIYYLICASHELYVILVNRYFMGEKTCDLASQLHIIISDNAKAEFQVCLPPKSLYFTPLASLLPCKVLRLGSRCSFWVSKYRASHLLKPSISSSRNLPIL